MHFAFVCDSRLQLANERIGNPPHLVNLPAQTLPQPHTLAEAEFQPVWLDILTSGT